MRILAACVLGACAAALVLALLPGPTGPVSSALAEDSPAASPPAPGEGLRRSRPNPERQRRLAAGRRVLEKLRTIRPPAPGDPDGGRRPAGEASENGRLVLEAFDPRVARAFMAARLTLFPLRNECGIAAAARLGRSWVFDAQFGVDLAIKAGRLVAKDLSFADGGSPGDPQFQNCLRRATASVSAACPDCREGDVTIPWALIQGFEPSVTEKR